MKMQFRCGEKEVMPTMQIDLYPTILGLTEGRTIKDRPIYFHFPHYSDFGSSPFSAVLYKDWKLYRYFNDSRGKGSTYGQSVRIRNEQKAIIII